MSAVVEARDGAYSRPDRREGIPAVPRGSRGAASPRAWADLLPPAGFAAQEFAQQKPDAGVVSDAFFCGQRPRRVNVIGCGGRCGIIGIS
jgi:hypothetical protein